MSKQTQPHKKVDATRRDPADDPKHDARPLADPSGQKGDVPENPDAVPGTITTNAAGQSREILLPDGTPAGGVANRSITPGGPDAVPTAAADTSTVQRAGARPLPTEAEALAELDAHPERSSVLSDKGHVTRRVHKAPV